MKKKTKSDARVHTHTHTLCLRRQSWLQYFFIDIMNFSIYLKQGILISRHILAIRILFYFRVLQKDFIKFICLSIYFYLCVYKFINFKYDQFFSVQVLIILLLRKCIVKTKFRIYFISFQTIVNQMNVWIN